MMRALQRTSTPLAEARHGGGDVLRRRPQAPWSWPRALNHNTSIAAAGDGTPETLLPLERNAAGSAAFGGAVAAAVAAPGAQQQRGPGPDGEPQPQQPPPPPDTGARDRADLYKAIGTGLTVAVAAGILEHQAVEDHQAVAMGVVFALGYAGIIAEGVLGFNKAGVALGTATALWIIRSTGPDPSAVIDGELSAALVQVSELVFFLVGAMAVVEAVDAHGGFRPLAAAVRRRDAPPSERNVRMLWGGGLLTFTLSAVLDNLTATIVMLSVLQRAVPDPTDRELRKLLGAAIVIAANAGGAWSPIGDVTTTMLWLHGQITPVPTIRDLLLPSLVSLLVPLALLQLSAPEFGAGVAAPQPPRGQGLGRSASLNLSSVVDLDGLEDAGARKDVAFEEASSRGPLVLAVGLAALVSVPAFKHFTGLPPYMGMLCGLSVLWLLTDALHLGESRGYPRVSDALRKLDLEAILFFVGILLSIGALDSAGILQWLAAELSAAVPSEALVATAIGGVSAVVDNVPLVAATMGMYSLDAQPPDSQLWQMIALAAGTGGSLLVIGSAAGVAYMSIEGAGFGWYLRRITPWAAAGYAAALAVYVLVNGAPAPSPGA